MTAEELSVDVHGEEVITEVSSKCGIDLVEDVKIHESPVNGHGEDIITNAASTYQDLPNGKDLVEDVKIHDGQVNGDVKDIINLDLEGEERSVDVAVDGYHDNGKMEVEGEKVEVECKPDDVVDVQNGKEEATQRDVETGTAEFSSETVAQEEPRIDEVVCGGTISDENGADLVLLTDDQAQGTISDLVVQVDGDKIALEQNGSSEHRESMPSSATVHENGVVECTDESLTTSISLNESLSGPMEVESELSVETASCTVAYVQLEKQVSEDLASDENGEGLPTGNAHDKLSVSDLVVDNGTTPEQNGHPDITEAGEAAENLQIDPVVDAMVVPEIENSLAIVQVENSAEDGEGAENVPTDPVVDAMVVPEKVENSSAIAQDIPASADGVQLESEAVKPDLESCETAVSHPDNLTSAEYANEEPASEVVKPGFETCKTTVYHPVHCTDVEPANVESEVNSGLGDKEATTDGDINTESKVSKAIISRSIPVDDAGEESYKIDSVENENSLTACPGADVKLEPETDTAPALSSGDMAADETIVAELHDVNGPDKCASDSDLNSVHVENGEVRPEVDNGHVEGTRDTTFGDSSEDEPVVVNGSDIGSENTPISIPDLAPAAENGRIRFTSEDIDIITGQDTVSAIASHKEEASASSQEDSITDASVKQNMVVEVVRRPFNFMIKVPRYDEENLKEQIKRAQLLVEKKTEIRDSVRVEIQKQRGTCQECGDKFEDAISEERAARGLLKSKRKEIDSVQSVINIVKDTMSVEDIDLRLRNLEHMISHETVSLKKEKEMIREIKQIKQLREQLFSNIGKQDEVQQALDQKDEVHERFKVLRKEADALRVNVLKTEVVTQAEKKKYYDESDNLSEWQAKFRAADDIQQEAYLHLQSLRKQLNEKNKYFWQYKDDVKAANDLVLKGDKDAIQHLCVNQVERFMKLWNENDEFRKEYMRCNSRSTLRRLRTLDGRSLGPDEVPPFIPLVVNPRTAKYRTMTPISTSGGEKQEEVVTVVAPVEADKKDNKATDKIGEQKIQTAKSNKAAKPVSSLDSAIANGLATVSGQDDVEESRKDEEEAQKATKEEEELARKAEELRKEEEAAKLKEKRRLEEKVKATEALERKKRNAEKAQARAAIRAQKEAEQKVKERERRLKKKEKRKAGATTEETNEESTPISESVVETPKEFETKEKPNPTMIKKPSQFAKQQSKAKSIPPPLRNRGKRRMQAWMWVLLAAVLVFGVFLLGNNYPSLKFEKNFN